MMKPAVYLETSIISYLTARPSRTIIGAAHQQLTALWWEQRDSYRLLVSEAVLRECAAGDPDAADRRLALVGDIPILRMNDQVADLAGSFVQQGIIPPKAAEDAVHIATATVYNVDYLLTWNCRHIANPDIQRGIAGYLDEQGLYMPFICTPEELLGEDENEAR